MKTCAYFLLAILFTVGCKGVTIQQPLGENEPAALKKLVGTWVNDDDKILETRLSKSGELFLGALSWDEAKHEFKTETLNIRATKSGDLHFLQAKSDPKSRDAGFAFARYEIDEGKSLRIYSPAMEVFEKAVNTGQLKGAVRKKQYETLVRLDSPAAAVLEFIKKTGRGACFENKPMLTLRLLRAAD